jgi:hypothetical protein
VLHPGPADLQAAFQWCYDQAGRSPVRPGSRSSSSGRISGSSGSNPFSSLFGGLFGGGGSSKSSSSSSSSSRAAGRGGDASGFPEGDVKVLQGLNDALLRLRVVYDDAEQRGRK